MFEGDSQLKHFEKYQQKVEGQPNAYSQENKAVQEQAMAKKGASNEESSPCFWFLLSCFLFVLAIGVYIGIWAITHFFKTSIVSQYYRQNNHYISQYIYLDPPGKSLYPYLTDNKNLKSIALSLAFSWLMWKLPMALFMLHLVIDGTNKILKFASCGGALLIMLAADILLTIFEQQFYQQYMFYAFSTLLIIITSVVNNRTNRGSGFSMAFVPLFYIALLYCSYVLFIPALFAVFQKFLDESVSYLFLYGYPIIDLLFYSGLLVINVNISQSAKPFLSSIQFFLFGYFCGITMLASLTQVQFYYLCAYILFRNFFTNWVMWQWETVVNNPPCLFGWPIVYYLSYIFNFLPLAGFGPIILSVSFKSYQFSQSKSLLSDVSINQISTSSPPSNDEYNIYLKGSIFYGAAIIIWGFSTFSQKYPRRKPTLFDFAYNIAGIYMFYIGISAGLELKILSNYVFGIK